MMLSRSGGAARPSHGLSGLFAALILGSILIPFLFYLSSNRLHPVDFRGAEALLPLESHVDLCSLDDERLLISGWALIKGDVRSIPIRVLVRSGDSIYEVPARVKARPDVADHLNMQHTLDMFGFDAASTSVARAISTPFEVILIKNGQNHQHGAVHVCH